MNLKAVLGTTGGGGILMGFSYIGKEVYGVFQNLQAVAYQRGILYAEHTHTLEELAECLAR